MKNNEKKRDIMMALYNVQPNLDLQVIITCDSTAVVGYLLTTDIVA